mgnify:CR=1 FL=1
MRELKPVVVVTYALVCVRRTPPGVRELKLFTEEGLFVCSSRTPPGVRELKPRMRSALQPSEKSHPSRGA